MRVIGIDPSLTGTGVATLRINPGDGINWLWDVGTVRTKPNGLNHLGTMLRIIAITQELDHFLELGDGYDLAVLEGPALGQHTGMAHERAGLWWHVYSMLAGGDFPIPVLVVPPNLRSKYATGDGRAGKDEVMLAAARRYPGAQITNNNEADAVLHAAMGARLLGAPIEKSLPQKHTIAMKTLSLPPVWEPTMSRG